VVLSQPPEGGEEVITVEQKLSPTGLLPALVALSRVIRLDDVTYYYQAVPVSLAATQGITILSVLERSLNTLN